VRDSATFFNSNGTPRHQAHMPSIKEGHASQPRAVSFPIYHDASILCLRYDDGILVTGSSDCTAIIYDLHNRFYPIRQLRRHKDVILDLAFDKRNIVTASKDCTVCVWDRHTGVLLHEILTHSSPVNSIQLQGEIIVICSLDASVKLWSMDNLSYPIREFMTSTTSKGLACSQISDDSRLIASVGADKKIRIWATSTGQCIREISAHRSLVRSVYIDSVSGLLIAGSYDQDINVFKLGTGKMMLQFPKWHSSWVLAAKSDYRRIISTGEEGGIVVMDFGGGVQGIEGLEKHQERRRRASYYTS
jgi:F-box and WD-40 domain protein 1/11